MLAISPRYDLSKLASGSLRLRCQPCHIFHLSGQLREKSLIERALGTQQCKYGKAGTDDSPVRFTELMSSPKPSTPPWKSKRQWVQALKLLAVAGPLLVVYAVVTRAGLDAICAKQDALFGLVQWCGISKVGSLAVLGILGLTLYRWFNKKS